MTLKESVFALARQGLGTREIYERLDKKFSYGSIAVNMTRFRREGGVTKASERGCRALARASKLILILDEETRAILDLEAVERKLATGDLALLLLRAICDDDLFKAVLDK